MRRWKLDVLAITRMSMGGMPRHEGGCWFTARHLAQG
jgi:hypothetical protein